MVMRDDNHLALHDGGKSIPVLGLESPEIPTPDKCPIVVQAEEVVRFLGRPGHEDILTVDTGGGGCEAIELVVRVYLRGEGFLPKFLSRGCIQAEDELFPGRLAGTSREQLVAPQNRGRMTNPGELEGPSVLLACP